tara:strand:- start:148 stop:774 length:627 start_codon:yes stop_codon:yes gene_type:complete
MTFDRKKYEKSPKGKARRKAHYERNKERYREKNRLNYQENKETYLAKVKLYRKTPKGREVERKSREKNKKSKNTRDRIARERIRKEALYFIASLWGFTVPACVCCHSTFLKKLAVDHIIPVADSLGRGVNRKSTKLGKYGSGDVLYKWILKNKDNPEIDMKSELRILCVGCNQTVFNWDVCRDTDILYCGICKKPHKHKGVTKGALNE